MCVCVCVCVQTQMSGGSINLFVSLSYLGCASDNELRNVCKTTRNFPGEVCHRIHAANHCLNTRNNARYVYKIYELFLYRK